MDFPREVDTPETTTFGNDDRLFIVGLRGATISASGFWDSTLDGTLAPIVGTAAGTFNYSPDGGGVTYSGECILTNYTQTSPVDGPAGWSADFQITGAVSR